MRAVTLTLLGLVFVISSRAAVPQSILLNRTFTFKQTSAEGNFAPNSDSLFQVFISFSGDATGTTAALRTPNGNVINIPQSDSTHLSYLQGFETENEINVAFPEGNYVMSFGGSGSGSYNLNFTLPPASGPVIITNLAELQNLTDNTAVVTWSAVPGVTSTDSLSLFVNNAADHSRVFASSGWRTATRQGLVLGLPARAQMVGDLYVGRSSTVVKGGVSIGFLQTALTVFPMSTNVERASLPVQTAVMPARLLELTAKPLVVDLRNFFDVLGVRGQVVQFDTVRGKFNAEMLSSDAPATVTNFLSYVGRGAYTNSLIHRSVPGFVVQGGGYSISGSTVFAIPSDPPVRNEFKRSNIRGTLAMAKLATGPDTATSQWFVNLADNASNLDAQNGGFTVFGRILGTGMTTVDSIAALPLYDAATTLGGAFGQLPLLSNSFIVGNLVTVRSIQVVPIYPVSSASTAVLQFTGSNSASSIVSATLAGSTLSLIPVKCGVAEFVVRATDTNGNVQSCAFTVSVVPAFSAQGDFTRATPGETISLKASTGSDVYQWSFNGTDISGASSVALNLENVQAKNAGIYIASPLAGNVAQSRISVLGLSTNEKVIGAGRELQPTDIPHANGNIFDQVLLEGEAATITADPDQITRMSYLDLNDDIVQVEFSGAGSLSIILKNPIGPALPSSYNQSIVYMKGHAGIVITGADETTNVSIFSVGRNTAVNQALFKSDINYNGMADIAFIAISSRNGKFGGLRTANASYSATKGITGVYAPGVEFTGPVFVGDICASDDATPMLIIGSSADTRVTGGDLFQNNGVSVRVAGLAQLKFTAGGNSHGINFPVSANRAILMENGVDISGRVVNYP